MNLAILVMMALLTIPAFGDSVPFAFQQNGTTEVSLANSPTLIPSYGLSKNLGGPYLQFGSVLPEGSGMMSLTIDGITQTVGLTSDGSSIVQGFNIPRNLYQPTDATLTIDMNGQVSMYDFKVVCPVSEPSTLLMAFSGLMLIGRKIHVSLRRS